MPDPGFRYARRADAAGLVHLIETAYRGADAAERWDSEAHLLRGPRTSRSEVQALVADTDSRFVLLDDLHRLLACALIQKHGAYDRRGEAAYFGMFAVHPDARTEGLGRRLLAECERRVQTLWGAPALVLTVISLRTELMAWYERRGYRPTGQRLPFPFSDTSGETRRDFDLVELRKDF